MRPEFSWRAPIVLLLEILEGAGEKGMTCGEVLKKEPKLTRSMFVEIIAHCQQLGFVRQVGEFSPYRYLLLGAGQKELKAQRAIAGERV